MRESVRTLQRTLHSLTRQYLAAPARLHEEESGFVDEQWSEAKTTQVRQRDSRAVVEEQIV